MLECPLYNPIRHKFPSLFENVDLGSLESFFQLDHEVDFSLYITKATTLCQSRIGWFDTIVMYFQTHQPFDFMDFKNIFI